MHHPRPSDTSVESKAKFDDMMASPVSTMVPRQLPSAWERKFLAEDGTEDPEINQQPLEAYLYYAARERLREENDYRPVPDAPWAVLLKKVTGEGVAITPKSPGQRRGPTMVREWFRGMRNRGPTDMQRLSSQASHGGSFDGGKHEHLGLEMQVRADDGFIITPHERETAYRIMRVSSWQVVFYLIFTDMCGWFSASQAYNFLGYGPGVLVYTFFWMLAFCCGQILWKMYMTLDSERYPIKSYGDIAERTFGPWFRNLVNVNQFALLGLQVATFIVMNGTSLSVIIDYKFCFVALNVFFTLFGILLSQIRTLRNISAMTYINFFMNIIVLCLTLFGVVLYDPIPQSSGHANLDEPVKVSAWVPETSSHWTMQIQGVQIAVFAYAGCGLFTEFMAEMRRPHDFWKSAMCAQVLIYCLYMFCGLFVYSMQGQYSSIFPISNIADRLFTSICGVLGLFLSITIGVLYAHIGSKMLYRILVRGYFHRPSLSLPSSAPWWGLTTGLYWAIAWVVGSAIPNILDLSNLISAALIIPMTYIVPPTLLVGHWIQRDALEGDGPWRPGMAPYANRVDSWRNASRWKRGFKPYWPLKIILLILIGFALSFMAISLYSSGLQVKNSFKGGAILAFKCRPGEA